MKKTRKKLIAHGKASFAGLCIAAALLSAGCGNASNSNAARTIPAEASSGLPNPLKVVFMQDQTGSTNWTRTPQVLPSDFEPLREVFRRQGGEAALGLIRDDSNRGLVRKRFPAPLPKPQPPVENDDIFEDAEAADNFQKQIVQWERDCALREKQIDQLFTDFLAEIKPLLEQKANARRTDVWSAVTRGDLCLNEGNAGWPQPTHRYLVLVTDGLDNVGKSRAAFKSGARVLLVNGSATVGSLASLNPDRFESVRAAIQEIASREGEKNGNR